MQKTLSEREVDDIIISYPSFYSIQDPLLTYIYENGNDEHEVKSIDTYDPLADYFNLSIEQRKRTYDDIYRNDQKRIYWRSLVYQAKESLYMRYIMPGPKGIWRLSSQGVERAKNFIIKEIESINTQDVEYSITEGKEKKVYSTRYERSAVARKICLSSKGYNCLVCSINFENMYGEIGKYFIHVHHTKPVSSNVEYKIDPSNDLVPVCPNCHSMLHKRTPPYSIEELREIIAKSSKRR